MKKILLATLPLLLLSACSTDETPPIDTGFDIECKDKTNGWNAINDTLKQDNGDVYELDGQWYCRDNYLWMSDPSLKNSPVGSFLVTKTMAKDNSKSYSRYTLMQTTSKGVQNLVINSLDSNAIDTGEVSTWNEKFNFTTAQGILPQMFALNNYHNDNYTVRYNTNAKLLTNLDKIEVLSVNVADIYTLKSSECTTGIVAWACQHEDLYVDSKQNIVANTPLAPTTELGILKADINKLEDATSADEEIKRLAAKLNL